MIKDLVKELSNFSTEEIISTQLELTQTIPFFDVELSSGCNVHCLMCPREKLNRESSLMKEKFMHHLINWFPSKSKVMLAGLGEPLLHPGFSEFLFALKKREIETGITTNGLLLTQQVVNKLIESQVDLIQVSFHSADERIYNKIIRGGSFSQLIKNLFYLSEKANNSTKINLAVTVQKDNKEDIEDIKQLASQLGFGVFLRHCHSRASINYNSLSYSTYLPVCGIFPKVCFINSDGAILLCCQDLKSQIILGHINNCSFEDILDKKRKVIKSKKEFPLCKHCDDDYRYYLIVEHLKANYKKGKE